MAKSSKPVRQRQRHFIREWRNYRGYDQNKLADMVGMTRENLSKIERQLVAYTQDSLEALAEAMSCEPADLVMRNPLDKSSLWSIHDQLAKAPAEKREHAAAIVEALLKTGTDG